MAYYSVEKRLRSDGTIRYRCTVGVKKDGKYIFRENKTFSKVSAAKSWGVRRVAEIEQSGLPKKESPTKIKVFELIQMYLDEPGLGGKSGKTKKYVLNSLKSSSLGNIYLSKLSVNDVIEHCKLRRSAGAGPNTVSQDVSYLTVALNSAKSVFDIEYTDNPARDAKPILNQMGIISKSNVRSRRPTKEEIQLILDALTKRESRKQCRIPYRDIFMFSILSCMRIGEVCKILWSDVDYSNRSVIVRDRKDPRKKSGNHMSVPLLGEAWDILNRQDKINERIFPYSSQSVSKGVHKVRDALGIEDLRYHDLRREGASRLFEAGFSIEDVAQVTGHKSLTTLWQVYTELFPQTLHDKYNKLTNK
ncbi:TPA: tyrosine-type recombinase/integrase [Proteus mirabilis]|uniref:tyrosine-type recombinase/integrase n=1 Tax=Proteus mirabilis TaxID=584 RepID=UPI0018C4DCF6|nr:site-specific integrase [Proteus mirabilis]MBG6018334.1 site-specific integrase [Proteus mirabilis]MCI9779244.1 site-specific integrase [Proteus mirabilis]HEK0329384.1 site-specific integrase [Proteus mirabilis]HEK0624354.1 site-specific integrase [Proteus mirabilis]HEK1719686.1 site-specific integrase [Proteus mirabilis]